MCIPTTLRRATNDGRCEHDQWSAANTCHEGGKPCHRYRSAGQAYSNEMRAILRCVYPDDDARGYVRSSATDGNGGWDFGKFHLRHALERPKYPLCGCEVISCFPRTDFARQSRTRTVVPAVQVQRSAADGIAWVEPMICHELTGMGVRVLGSHTNSSCMAYFVSLVRIATNVHGNGACHARMWQYLQHAMTETA